MKDLCICAGNLDSAACWAINNELGATMTKRIEEINQHLLQTIPNGTLRSSCGIMKQMSWFLFILKQATSTQMHMHKTISAQTQEKIKNISDSERETF